MVSNQARKFAEVSLQLYGEEKSFDISASHAAELEAFAAAFESLDCAVERDTIRLRLHVRTPDSDA